ncbi:MAG: hypothetical protein LBQ56_04385, partial [Synergistaceae bacterium]|nr:hypothetical protein [Synergistaceae bacterium]
EPTGNLDETNEGIVMDIMHKLHEEGSTIVVVTHDPEVAEFAEKTVFLEHGRIAKIVTNDADKKFPARSQEELAVSGA